MNGALLIEHRPLQVGDRLPDLVKGPVSRSDLALFAGASYDYTRLHIDSDYARAAGMEDVFVHGMLSMAYLAQLLTGRFGETALVDWKVRFLAITPVHAVIHSFAEVAELFAYEGEPRARLKIGCRTGDGLATLDGHAVVRFT